MSRALTWLESLVGFPKVGLELVGDPAPFKIVV
jgi:hypothetical protein